jgi:integrase
VSRPRAQLRSLLADPIGAFLQYKTALGCKYRTEAAALLLLDAYLADQRVVVVDQLDSRLIEAFLASRPREHARSYNHLVGVIRRFFDWAAMPVNVRPRRVTGQRIPYLFSLADAQRLLEVARNMRTRPKAPYRALVYETVFALLYGLGLRVGEVSRLLVGDVDFERAMLSVRDTKFYKSRLVPFGPHMGERLARYVDRRFGPQADPEAPLFSFTRRGAVHEGTISLTFHSLLPQLKLDVPAGVCTPRLHDLRHAFAVGTLLRWYRLGVDPSARLIRLATFLGHADPASTAVYLTITEDLMREADRRFHVFVPQGGRS